MALSLLAEPPLHCGGEGLEDVLSSVGEVEVEAPEGSAANVCVVVRLITENQDYTHIRTYVHTSVLHKK